MQRSTLLVLCPIFLRDLAVNSGPRDREPQRPGTASHSRNNRSEPTRPHPGERERRHAGAARLCDRIADHDHADRCNEIGDGGNNGDRMRREPQEIPEPAKIPPKGRVPELEFTDGTPTGSREERGNGKLTRIL